MRLTVGPLSPNVYWRRRAVVLAGALVFVLIVAYSCSGDDEPGKKPTANNPTSTGTSTETSTAQALPTITPNASEPSSGRPVTGGGGNTGVTGEGATGETCTDTELLVTSAAENQSVRQGVPVTFFIRIKNVSSRTCSRDLSAQAQELYLEQNSAKQWSSDSCSNAASTADVRRMQPNDSLQFNVPWNGQGTAQGCTNRKLLSPGTYQLRARLGNIISEPVTVTINA